MLFDEVVQASRRVASTTKRSEKVALLAALLRSVPPLEADIAIGLLLGAPRQGRVGVGWATLAGLDAVPAAVPTVSIAELDQALGELARMEGAGSQGARSRHMTGLLERCTADEQQHLVRVLAGELRQGANAGVVTDAVAKAAGRPLAEVRRAAMLLGDLGVAATRALAGEPLDNIGLTTLVGVQPMLAATATSVGDALVETGPASVEWKLDGARVQVHRQGDDVRVFTRTLHEISARVPAIVEAALGLPGDDLVLDGEALGLDLDGNPLKFQDTMQTRASLRPFFFDVLRVGDDSLIDEPLAARKAILADQVPSELRLPTLDTSDPTEAEAFSQAALAAGHEGVMVKALDSPYAAGRRGKAWRKVKPLHTLDLVVLAAEWGHGRRSGWLSNVHLGARGPDGTFVMVGKTFKGMTDELLRWQTEAFQQLSIGSEGHVVHVRPECVVEIAVDGVQRSSRYPGGVALRFARVRRYRPDKSPAEADSIEAVRALL